MESLSFLCLVWLNTVKSKHANSIQTIMTINTLWSELLEPTSNQVLKLSFGLPQDVAHKVRSITTAWITTPSSSPLHQTSVGYLPHFLPNREHICTAPQATVGILYTTPTVGTGLGNTRLKCSCPDMKSPPLRTAHFRSQTLASGDWYLRTCGKRADGTLEFGN